MWNVYANGSFWQASHSGRIVAGNKQQIESFLDAQEQIRKRRAKKRMAKLLNWLYNQKK